MGSKFLKNCPSKKRPFLMWYLRNYLTWEQRKTTNLDYLIKDIVEVGFCMEEKREFPYTIMSGHRRDWFTLYIMKRVSKKVKGSHFVVYKLYHQLKTLAECKAIIKEYQTMAKEVIEKVKSDIAKEYGLNVSDVEQHILHR